jgi:hypothetical protein
MVFFAQDPSVTWKFDYSSQKIPPLTLQSTLKVDISHFATLACWLIPTMSPESWILARFQFCIP